MKPIFRTHEMSWWLFSLFVLLALTIGAVWGVSLAEDHDRTIFDAFIQCEINLVGYESGLQKCGNVDVQACVLEERYAMFLRLNEGLE